MVVPPAPQLPHPDCKCGPLGGNRRNCKIPEGSIHIGEEQAVKVKGPAEKGPLDNRCPGCAEIRGEFDEDCQFNLCAECCAFSGIKVECKAFAHKLTRRTAARATEHADDLIQGKKKKKRHRSPSVKVSSDSDEGGPTHRKTRRGIAEPAKDALKREGAYASHVISASELYERIIRAWRSERFRTEDAHELSLAFDTFTTDILSDEADMLNENIRGVGTDHTRHYIYATDPDLLSKESRIILAMALRAAGRWGQSLVTILKCVAYAEQDISKTATAFMNIRMKCSANVAMWREVQTSQPAGVGPSSALPAGYRLADPDDYITLGLHMATLTPERIRVFLQGLTRAKSQVFCKQNSKALISSSEWTVKHGAPQHKPVKDAPAAHRGRGGGGGRGDGGRGGGGRGGGGGGQGGGDGRRDRNRRNRGGGGGGGGDRGGGGDHDDGDREYGLDPGEATTVRQSGDGGGRGGGGGRRGGGAGRGGRGGRQ